MNNVKCCPEPSVRGGCCFNCGTWTEDMNHIIPTDPVAYARFRRNQALIGQELKVLDHGYIKIIDIMGVDEDIIEAARMSTGRGFVSWDRYQRCTKCERTTTDVDAERGKDCSVAGAMGCQWQDFPNGDLGTLDFLYRHKHMTPFEMCSMVIEVQAPLMVFREWHRHRTQKFNEFSARYAIMPNLHYLPPPERLKALTSGTKQQRSMDDHLGEKFDLETMLGWIGEEQEDIYKNYETLLKEGVPKEVARINTPVSRYSKMRAKTDLRNWLGFLNLRARPNAQWEIRQYADAIIEIMKPAFPKTYSLFEEYDLYGASLSRTELRVLRQMLTTKHNLDEAGKENGLTGSKLKELEKKIREGGEVVL